MKRESSRPFVLPTNPSVEFPETLAEFLKLADAAGFLENDGSGNLRWRPASSGGVTGSLGEVGDAIILEWAYADEARDFELFSPLFSWRDIAPIGVLEAVAGDDTLDLATTEGLKVAETYVLVSATGALIETIEVSKILTDRRVRARLPIGTTIKTADKVVLARTSAEVRERSAVFENNDVFYSEVLEALRVQTEGRLFLRRSADGTGRFKVFFRDANGERPWTEAKLIDVRSRKPETRDEEFFVPLGGRLKFRITYEGATAAGKDTLHHIVLGPSPRAQAADFVERPINTTPAIGAINVGETPTLIWSAYRSLYGEAQGGAHVKVALDPEMTNLVLSTSTDWLASWVSVAGRTEAFTGLVARAADSFVAVANGFSAAIAQNGSVSQLHTVTGDLTAVDADPGLVVAVGKAGAIRTLADGQTAYVNRAAGGGYNGDFAGVSVRGNRVCAVGTGAEIQFSANATIFGKVVPDAAYTGSFTAVCGDGTGRTLAVGSSGMIQTSPTDGESGWVRREAPAGYTGTYRGCAMLPNGRGFAVGDNGAIHETFDGGATWADGNPDKAFAGTFNAVAIVAGYAVATGASGEIQTKKLDGGVWTRRTAGAGETGTMRAVALDPNGDAVIVGAAGILQRTFRLAGAVTQFAVPSGMLKTNKVYFWSVSLSDARGRGSPFSAPTAFATGAIFRYVAQPANTAPAPGDALVSLRPTLQSSAFSAVGGADIHQSSRWRIVKDSAGSIVAYDSGPVTDLVSHTIPAGALLDNETDYFFQVAHIGQTFGQSAWSKLTGFKTKRRPERPVITAPTEGARDVAQTTTITTSSFSQVGGGSHAKSRYQIARDAAFANIVHDSGEVTNLTSYPVPSGALQSLTDYFVRALHRNTDGASSDWSGAVGFRTQAPTGEAIFTAGGNFVVPEGVTRISVTTTAFGGAGGNGSKGADGGSVSFGTFVTAYGGKGGNGGSDFGQGGAGGTGAGGNGGDGGSGGNWNSSQGNGGGGGAGGYGGMGGDGSPFGGQPGQGGGGGGGGGQAGGGGVGLKGQGASGQGGASFGNPGQGGSGGAAAIAAGSAGGDGADFGGGGGGYGGGAGGGGGGTRYINDIAVTPGENIPVTFGNRAFGHSSVHGISGSGGRAGLRVIWGTGRSFPNNAA